MSTKKTVGLLAICNLAKAMGLGGFKFTKNTSFQSHDGYGWEVHLKKGKTVVGESFNGGDGGCSMLRNENKALLDEFLAMPAVKACYEHYGEEAAPAVLSLDALGEERAASLIGELAEYAATVAKIKRMFTKSTPFMSQRDINDGGGDTELYAKYENTPSTPENIAKIKAMRDKKGQPDAVFFSELLA